MRKKILVVDDDRAIAEFVVMTLEPEPYDVSIASDGREGLDKAAQLRPDLVILDLMMPKIHGYEVCQQLRSDERNRGMKILVTSSKNYAADIDQAKSAGADDYLPKPYMPNDLIKKVRGLIGPDGHFPSSSGSGIPSPYQARYSAPGTREEDMNLARGYDSVSFSEKVVKDAARTPRPRIQPRPTVGTKVPVMVRFWGTRGSSPAPGPRTVRYGGNTSCTELRMGDMILIIDCGTGIRELGIALLEEFKEKPITGHIFVGHTHWDHIQGFPFFGPLYVPRNQFTVHSVRAAGKSLEKVFRGQMAADYFPVPLQSLASSLQFEEMEDMVELGPIRVSYHFLNHPGVAIGFRFDAPGASICYISDHEPYSRLNVPSELTQRQDQAIVEFARGCDLLISEAQYTEEEYRVKRGWGHSTFEDAVDRAIQSGAKRLAVFHHDPTHTDEMMDRFIEQCKRRVKAAGSPMECFGALEGQTVSL